MLWRPQPTQKYLNWVLKIYTIMKTGSQLVYPSLTSIKHKYISRIISTISFCVLMFFIEVPALCQQFNTSEWKFESQREAIAPVWYVDGKTLYKGNQTLALKGGGKEYADGHWYNKVNVEPGEYFQFRAYFTASKVEEPNRSILARILWQNESGELVGFAEYPVTLREKTKEGWSVIEQSYKVPAEAKKAKIELHYRWDADGIVHFGGVSFQKSNPPEPRKVRLATINYRPGTVSHPGKTWKNFQNSLPKQPLKRLILSVFRRALLWRAPILIIFQQANLFPAPQQNSLEILPGNIIYILLQASWKEKGMLCIIPLYSSAGQVVWLESTEN